MTHNGAVGSKAKNKGPRADWTLAFFSPDREHDKSAIKAQQAPARKSSSTSMQNSFDMTTIVFALLAAFVVWKLRSVLGTRNGAEKPPSNPFASRAPGRFLRARRGDADSGDSGNRVIPLPGAAESPVAIAPAKDDRWKPNAEPGQRAVEDRFPRQTTLFACSPRHRLPQPQNSGSPTRRNVLRPARVVRMQARMAPANPIT